jgi:hypothetical protein
LDFLKIFKTQKKEKKKLGPYFIFKKELDSKVVSWFYIGVEPKPRFLKKMIGTRG